MLLKNIISLLIPAALALGASYLLNTFTTLISPYTNYALLFFLLVCFILNIMQTRHAHSDSLSGLLIAGIVIKMLLSFTVIIVYSFIDHPRLFAFAIHFILYYILFTVFEIRYLLQLIKNNSNKQHL